MADSDEFETFEGAKCVAETPNAIRVRLDNGNRYWIPKSVVHDDSEVFEADGEGKLIVKSWFCEKEGIE